MTTAAPALSAPSSPQSAAPGNPALGPSAAPTQIEVAVRVALSLGWIMSDLYELGLPEQRPGRAGAAHKRLPGVGRLSPSQRALLRLDQIDAAVAALASIIQAHGLHVPATSALRTAQGEDELKPKERSVACRAVIYALHVNLLRTLTAADFRLGKAYGLGRALADTCRAPQSCEELEERFRRERLDNLRDWLNDSASNLPDHSAKAVLAGLVRWEAWVANLIDAMPETVEAGVQDAEQKQQARAQEWARAEKPIATTLRRQGQLWRAVLSGEKDARDMLSADSYVQAADAMAQRALALARPLLRRPVVYLPLGALAAAALLLLGWGVASEGASQLTAGIATAAAALGITWKTVGATAQKLGEALEKPLWGAELDAAAGKALTYLPLVPVTEPRADILLDAPRLLHDTYILPKPSRARSPLRQEMPVGEQTYLCNWAEAAGYIETTVDAQGSEHKQLSQEGERLADIPPRERGTIRAVLGAGRGMTARGQEDDPHAEEDGPHAEEDDQHAEEDDQHAEEDDQHALEDDAQHSASRASADSDTPEEKNNV